MAVSSSSSASSSYREINENQVYTVWHICHRMILLSLFLPGFDILPTNVRWVFRVMIVQIIISWDTSPNGYESLEELETGQKLRQAFIALRLLICHFFIIL
jgi:hypothetical protein